MSFRSTSVEHDCLVSVHDDPPFSIPLHSRCEHLTLYIAALLSQVFWTHAVVDSGDSLLDDRSLIKVRSDKVCCCSDNFDATIVGLEIWSGALERRQKAVMDVDDLARHGLAQSRTEYLHIACKYDQIYVVLLDEVQYLSLLVKLGRCRHGKMVKWNAVAGGQRLEVFVVGNDQRYLDGQLSTGLSEQQIIEAMSDLGAHDEHTGLLGSGP